MRRASSRPATTSIGNLSAACARRVGAHGAHGAAVEIAQPLAETLQARERPFLRGFVEALVLREPGAQANRLAQGIEGIDLVADDPHDLAVEAVRAQVDGGEIGLFRHRSVPSGEEPANPDDATIGRKFLQSDRARTGRGGTDVNCELFPDFGSSGQLVSARVY